jgi:hypothetical protein
MKKLRKVERKESRKNKEEKQINEAERRSYAHLGQW